MCFNLEKSYCISVLILLLLILGEIPKHHFLKVGGGGGGTGGGTEGWSTLDGYWVESELLTFFYGRHK